MSGAGTHITPDPTGAVEALPAPPTQTLPKLAAQPSSGSRTPSSPSKTPFQTLRLLGSGEVTRRLKKRPSSVASLGPSSSGRIRACEGVSAGEGRIPLSPQLPSAQRHQDSGATETPVPNAWQW